MTSPNPQLKKMRRLATGLLVLMVIAYATSRTLEETIPAWAWVRSFAEAAMIGALADWFAVTALFRHPLGLPIPHTAIVRKEQARIGQAVASFVRKSFLAPEEITRQWSLWQPLGSLVRRTADPKNSEKMIRWALAQIPKLLGKADQKALARMGSSGLRRGISGMPLARVATILMQGFLKSPGRRSLIAPLLGKIGNSISQNRQWVMDEAVRSAPPQKNKMFDILGKAAASAVSGKAVEKLSAELAAASEDETHPLFDKIDEVLRDFASELEHGDTSRWELLKARILEDPELGKTFEEIFENALTLIKETAEKLQGSETVSDWALVLSKAAKDLEENPARLRALEDQVGALTSRLSQRVGDKVETLIARTVESWEADELIARIENQVGSDLQFIRINGTLIGGLVGLTLHGIGKLIW